MHELSIAQSLLDIVVEEANRHGVTKVRRVGVRVGAFTNVVPDSLSFCFDLIKEGTVAAEAELKLTPVPLAGLCQDCGAELDMSEAVFACPQCQSANVKVTQGQELLIDYIETDEAEA
ncbi:MAG: hydrogenase maturation nickel metallochaperone HypA [Desulfarculus sp.]|nr:hydrogenase maturation nickel metallochaperone HypA [Desulfarculus sp.]